MPVWIEHVYECDFSIFMNKIETGSRFQRIPFKDVQPNKQNCLVVGRISDAYRIHNHPLRGQYRKLVIEEENYQDGDLKLVVFLYDIFAADINYKKKDLIAIANMEILALPLNDDVGVTVYPYYLAVKKLDNEPFFWAMTRAFPEDKKSNLHYTYTKIVELQNSQKQNFYGIVKEVMPAKKTSGTDFLKKINVVDRTSYNHPDFKNLWIHVFAKEEEEFPEINKGDVVRCHRVQMENFLNSMRGTIHDASYILVWSSDLTASIVPRSSAANYSFCPRDKEEVHKLRKWFSENKERILSVDLPVPKRPAPKTSTAVSNCNPQSSDLKFSNISSLSQVRLGSYYDFICQVLGIFKVNEKHVALTVWDCSEISGFLYQGEIPYILQYCEEVLLHETKKYVVNISVFDEHCKLAEKIKPGSIALFRNVRVCLGKGNNFVRFYMHTGFSYNRGITVLPEAPEHFTKKLEKLYENMKGKRIWKTVDNDSTIEISEEPIENTKDWPTSKKRKACEKPTNQVFSMLNPLTVISGHHHIQHVTIAHVLQHSVPYKFRLLVELKDYKPLLHKNPFRLIYYQCVDCGFVKPFDEKRKNINVSQLCPRCSISSIEPLSEDIEMIEAVHLTPIMMLHFTLVDETGTLPVLLYGKEAETFFRKISAEKYLKDEATRLEVQQHLDRICPLQASKANRENEQRKLDVCIVSYKTGVEVKYQIFDTILNHLPTEGSERDF